MQIDKFDSTKCLEDLRHVVLVQGRSKIGNEKSVVRDRSVSILFHVETRREGKSGTQRWEVDVLRNGPWNALSVTPG